MSELSYLPITSIRPGTLVANDRTRFDAGQLQELAASIAEHGVLQPLTVRPVACGYEIIAGERRWRASQLAGLVTVPCIVRELSDEEAASLMLIENVNRADLSPMEEARAYNVRRVRFGWTVAQVARETGKNAEYVRRRLALLDLLPEVQQLVASGTLPVSHAEEMAVLLPESQAAAVKALTGRDGLPSVVTFRRIVGELVERESQLGLFDLEAFAVQRREELEAAPQSAQRTPALYDALAAAVGALESSSPEHAALIRAHLNGIRAARRDKAIKAAATRRNAA